MINGHKQAHVASQQRRYLETMNKERDQLVSSKKTKGIIKYTVSLFEALNAM